MSVNVAIVVYENPLLMIKAAVDSVLQEKELVDHLYLIDNSPTDRLRKSCKSGVDYLFTGENLGFGKANNIAMRKKYRRGDPVPPTGQSGHPF